MKKIRLTYLFIIELLESYKGKLIIILILATPLTASLHAVNYKSKILVFTDSMTLHFQKEIDKIENCPNNHSKGNLTLYRVVENPVSQDSFLPQAVLLKPKYKGYCEAWGISLFSRYETATMNLKGLSKKKRPQYRAIAESLIEDSDGIKYCGKDKRHYTFFPRVELDLVEKFKIVR